MSFDRFNMDSRLARGISHAGYVTPTPIQEEAIPPALAGRDLIATAQTGTGKTAVFVLPILHKLLSGPRGRTRALIVTPTRELAEQIHECIQTLAAGTRLRSATVYGGVSASPQIKALRAGVDIVVACPGRLLDHLENRRANLSGVEMLVLDEADRMLDMGFMPAVREILTHIPARRQTMMFSATFPPEIESLAAEALSDPQRVALGLGRPVHTVAHALYPVAAHLKTPLLLAILERTDTESVLIFTRTKHRAERLMDQINRAGWKATSLHSNRSQSQRQAALKGFKSGTYQIMVATDIAARGLDIENITHVINYDMPDCADAYIHRIGRTGRAERTGDAFTLTTPEDRAMVKTLERIMDQALPKERLEGFDYLAANERAKSAYAAKASAPAPGQQPRTKPNARRSQPSNRQWARSLR